MNEIIDTLERLERVLMAVWKIAEERVDHPVCLSTVYTLVGHVSLDLATLVAYGFLRLRGETVAVTEAGWLSLTEHCDACGAPESLCECESCGVAFG